MTHFMGTPVSAWMRGGLIVAIAFITALLSKPEFDERQLMFAFLQALIAWKSFLDQSLSEKPLV